MRAAQKWILLTRLVKRGECLQDSSKEENVCKISAKGFHLDLLHAVLIMFCDARKTRFGELKFRAFVRWMGENWSSILKMEI